MSEDSNCDKAVMNQTRKSWHERQCEHWCKAICYQRAGGRCEICHEPVNINAMTPRRLPHHHHWYFGPWAMYWQLRYNPAFFVLLDLECHLEAPYAPHVRLPEFKALYFEKLRRSNPARVEVLRAQDKRNLIERPPLIRMDDWKELMRQLKREAEIMEKTAWMDVEACQVRPGVYI